MSRECLDDEVEVSLTFDARSLIASMRSGMMLV
jgi:hypothetical protein